MDVHKQLQPQFTTAQSRFIHFIYTRSTIGYFKNYYTFHYTYAYIILIRSFHSHSSISYKIHSVESSRPQYKTVAQRQLASAHDVAFELYRRYILGYVVSLWAISDCHNVVLPIPNLIPLSFFLSSNPPYTYRYMHAFKCPKSLSNYINS